MTHQPLAAADNALVRLIGQRRSGSALTEPGPDDAQLAAMLEAAARAPDHGQLRPFRFVVVRGDARRDLGRIARAGLERSGVAVDEDRLAKAERSFTRSPVVVISVLRPVAGRIPLEDQFACVAAATQNLLLAATALGFGSIWRTGALVTLPAVREALGLRTDDRLVGFIHLGTSARSPHVRVDADLAAVVRDWQPTLSR